jgi:SAM-dependent methyltransferase
MVSPPEPPGEDGYFDERVAATFDEEYDYQAEDDVVAPMVELIAGLARGKRALELGSGTGRIAIPLAARGVPVHGIELSKAMTRRLKAKPGGQGIEVTVGDFASARAPGTFGIAYLVANTIMNLTTQAEQVACFRNVAAHLEPGGVFLIEVLVPGLQRLPPGDTFQVFAASDGHWGIDEIDPATQRLVSHHFTLVGATYELDSIPFRYVWPAELDLMAELAGL